MKLLLCLLVLISTPVLSHADESYTFIVKKQEQKKATRWSLADWFETKEKMRLQDMWLALHSPSPYEFFLGYDLIANNPVSHRITLGAYASIVGLEGRYETLPYGDAAALFKLRFFGYHVQATHLSIGAGIRNRIDPILGAYRNPILNIEGTIYLMKYFGIFGDYEYYLASSARSNGTNVTGSRIHSGSFIDFGFFRVTGGFFAEWSSDVAPGILMSGFNIGAKIFF